MKICIVVYIYILLIDSDYPPYTIFYGHVGQVTSLLYPHDENPRYDRSFLMSGGADFTVRAWDLISGSLLTVFHCHGGEILRLMVTPPDCNVSFMYNFHLYVPCVSLYVNFNVFKFICKFQCL